MGLRWKIYCDAEYLKRTFKRCFLLCFMYIKNKQLYILYHKLKKEFHLKTTIKERLCLCGPNFPILSQQFSCSVVSNCLRPHGLQHARPPCPSPAPRVYSNSCPLSLWCHPTISSSVVPYSSCLQSLLASGSFPMSQFFTSGGQRTGVSASASVLPMNIQDWFPLGWIGWISLQSKGLLGLLQHHSSEAPILWHSALFTVKL